MTRGVVTIAVGKPVYFQMATMLARSFERWNADNDIGFALITDHDLPLPRGLRKTSRVQVEKGELPPGFESKLYLESLSPFQQTLFVDSDCLCFADLTGVFERFSGVAFSTVGTMNSSGEFFGDIERRRSTLRLGPVPVFVGSIYYFEAGERSAAVFDRARSLVSRYDELGFVRLRGKPNEEPLLSAAMAENGLSVIADDGSIKADAMDCLQIDCNVLSGHRRVNHSSGKIFSPAILHFNDSYAEGVPYTTEKLALHMAHDYGAPRILARTLSTGLDRTPREIIRVLKDFLRPAYRRMFGFRRVISANR